VILIDAIYINGGGGKILLDYLIDELEKKELLVYYLLDVRIKNNHPKIKSSNKIEYIQNSIIKRYFFYKKNKLIFSKILCFGNLPPNIRVQATVFTYFHQTFYLKIPNEFSLFERLKYLLKIQVLKKFIRNTDFWLVQSSLIKRELEEKFYLKSDSVLSIPFYPKINSKLIEITTREFLSYIYVSDGTPHKNHERLIKIFCEFYDKYKKGKLVLTINQNFPLLLELIEFKIKQSYPIINIGFVDRNTLHKKYIESEFLIFPSLTESFGLGLIEAMECGCKVIGADLAYTYEVCEPSIVFDPLSDSSMFAAFEKSMSSDLSDTKTKINNNIAELLNFLK
jgi:glycosyltransferase involved in cell wall biosynthesis